ncbi:FAD-dependent oxidoreductase [Halomonas halodenitrificans]|uniref:FAD-dependent oxidoreductase n=1 Tax=Halomonas halodenitrificans TaxID=28252 RepID=UPI0012EB81E7|nr:FAD-dependent oxidoreductase [Halomonas halodenitrificans]
MKVAVIGLGAIGIQVLWQLSRINGVEAHGFDKAYPGHPSAGAGGESRLYWNMELVEPSYIPLIERAAAAWKKLESASGQVLRDPTGVLIYGSEGAMTVKLVGTWNQAASNR